MTTTKLEKVAESNYTNWIRDKTVCMSLKLNVMGLRGFPDRITLCPMGRVYFVEFKREGKKPRKMQEYIHRMLRSLGFLVLVTDSAEEAKAFHDKFISAARLPDKGD